MDYSQKISSMIWSYSKITTYEDCPYKFYLKYIEGIKGDKLFFSDYGSFIHEILEMYLKGELSKEELSSYYLAGFVNYVHGHAPTPTIFKNYFTQGLEYLKNIDLERDNCIGVEKKVTFELEGNKFVGYIDFVKEKDGKITIWDNKSKSLKPRTKTGKTKSDKELDSYLRQLYLYASAIKDEYDKYPEALAFNCFRTNTKIIEPFCEDRYKKVKAWAVETIKKITKEQNWKPNIEQFKCEHICDVCKSCEYYEMIKQEG